MDFGLLKGFMDSWAEEFTPGCGIIVYKDNKEVLRHYSGFSDMKNKESFDCNKLYNIYSCSKVVTVVAALQLLEKGVFSLDDPLYDFIPEYKHMYVRGVDGSVSEAKNTILLRNLFTMTAGFGYDFHTPGFEKADKLTDGKNDTLTVARCIADDPLLFEPGTKWNYSICHDVLAAVVQAVTGMRFSEYVYKNIFEPLEMTDSYYHVSQEQKSRVAMQYQYYPEGISDPDMSEISGIRQPERGVIKSIGIDIGHVIGDQYDSGGAGITTLQDDYARFVAALANGGVGINGERILSTQTIDLMRTNQLSQEQMQTYTWPDLKGYGYGLGVRTLLDKTVYSGRGSVGEFGWSGAAGALAICDPTNKLAVFFLQHLINSRADYFIPRLFDVLYSCIR